jgi:hypothetical protein
MYLNTSSKEAFSQRFFPGVVLNKSYPKPILRRSLIATPGANPTIGNYNVSAVKIYNATSILVRFENKNIFSTKGKTLYPTTTLALL